MAHAPALVLRHIRTLLTREVAGRLPDGELMQRFAGAREEEAFAAIVRRHGRLVLDVCRRVLGNEHDAEDAFQATFLVLARRPGSIRKRGSLASWLHGVAYRVALGARADAARRRARERQAAPPVRENRGDDLTWRELRVLLDEELQGLPEKYRAPLILCYLEGKTQDEAARELGWTPGMVKGRLERGREQLRRRLTHRGVALSTALLATALTESLASAAVPALLAKATTQAALLFSAGQAAAAGSAQAVALAKGVMQTTLATQLKATVPALVALGLLAASAGLAAHHLAGPEQTAPPSAAPKPAAKEAEPAALSPEKQTRLDRYGDPLPEGAIQRLGTLRFRQGGGFVNRLLLTPDGKTLVSKSYCGERAVCAWELATGKLLRQFPGHWAENGAVALSPDGTELAIGQDATIHFYDLASGSELRQIKSPLGGTEGLAFSPDGKVLASGHDRQTVIFWDLSSTGRELGRLAAKHNSLSMLAFSPDGKTLATSSPLDRTVRLFDVASRKQRQHLTRAVAGWDFALSHNAFAFSPNSSTLAIAGQGGTIIPLRDVATGKLIRELRGSGRYVQTPSPSTGTTMGAPSKPA